MRCWGPRLAATLLPRRGTGAGGGSPGRGTGRACGCGWGITVSASWLTTKRRRPFIVCSSGTTSWGSFPCWGGVTLGDPTEGGTGLRGRLRLGALRWCGEDWKSGIRTQSMRPRGGRRLAGPRTISAHSAYRGHGLRPRAAPARAATSGRRLCAEQLRRGEPLGLPLLLQQLRGRHRRVARYRVLL